MKITRFEDLECWQEARDLTKNVYSLTNAGLFKQDYGLTDQIRRSAVSIMANVAEGFSRKTDREFVQFLFIAKGSASELQSHLYVATDQGYAPGPSIEYLHTQIEGIHKRISNLIKYLKSGK